MDTITETMRNIESMFKRNEPKERETYRSIPAKLVKKLMIEHNFENKDVFENTIVVYPESSYTGKSTEGKYAELNNLLHSMEIGSREEVLSEHRANVHNYARGTGKKFTTTVNGVIEGYIIVKRIA